MEAGECGCVPFVQNIFHTDYFVGRYYLPQFGMITLPIYRSLGNGEIFFWHCICLKTFPRIIIFAVIMPALSQFHGHYVSKLHFLTRYIHRAFILTTAKYFGL